MEQKALTNARRPCNDTEGVLRGFRMKENVRERVQYCSEGVVRSFGRCTKFESWSQDTGFSSYVPSQHAYNTQRLSFVHLEELEGVCINELKGPLLLLDDLLEDCACHFVEAIVKSQMQGKDSSRNAVQVE